MKQKLLQSLMLIAALLTGTHAHAYDFTSDGIYYTIKSSTYNTIEVTYRYINYGSYSGDITIPETIIYNDILRICKIIHNIAPSFSFSQYN